MISELIDTLTQVGKSPYLWISPDGSRVLVLPYGGRILGLFPPDSNSNFFWTHPALNSTETAQMFYAGEQWHNSGGERTWLSPEIDFFLPDFPSLDTYFQPREFDPGNYQLKIVDSTPTLQNTFTSQLSRSGNTANLCITKSLMPAQNPLCHIEEDRPSSLRYAGFAMRTGLRILGSTGPVELNLWSLLQLPHRGSMIIPTYYRASVIHFMGKIPHEDIEITDSNVYWKMHAIGESKIGIHALPLTGRIGYMRLDGNESTLVVRAICVNPSAKYLDTPWTALNSKGAAVEACNVNSSLGAFSELEYHTPAIGMNGESNSEDISQVWAYSGPEYAVKYAAKLLLRSSL